MHTHVSCAATMHILIGNGDMWVGPIWSQCAYGNCTWLTLVGTPHVLGPLSRLESATLVGCLLNDSIKALRVLVKGDPAVVVDFTSRIGTLTGNS